MLKRQSLWVPVVKHNPAFLDGFRRFLTNNPITILSCSLMNVKPEDIHVALVPDARHPSKQVAAMMAFPVRVAPAACDNVHDHAHHDKPVLRREIAFGFATTVCDSFNSLHVMERLLPHSNAHVSVNIQSQMTRPLREGETAVVVSSIDKFGKRLVYCKAEFFVEPAEGSGVLTPEFVERERNLRTVDDLRAALMYYEKTMNGTHVKSILPDVKAK
ncbi:putative mitochondrial hypothetical protein [Leptomonas pyrrhocoris]|uniref:Thioesterase domain-containing protein n=1 Tax=Leptomonas pyrrhocoris TaxID=157538 RepID=A0A0M9FXW0_LEPPY|nr:putative mitochondrial hypothetical protein [Leptomonas pyrrhocoris]XP_015656608.1 putative mitochondrial hypothetical protein [Leptomonas pyrrhocoris]KPA78168.1 putative mitochondrial hypothetical protein [Leptomonas pyrrhocoris]KPA78169.1 putative mitochondrial hypothetical protein [Leptomonas pyrrhocoris]|eukprot:XP_015656607.1 putative mitochondrial hypothetical protein [Leptomonas pyrrhocoris]